MNLYKMSDWLSKLMNKIEQEDLTDEQIEEIQKEFVELQEWVESKLDSMCHIMRKFEANVEQIKNEKIRLTKLQKSYENKVNSMKKFIQFILERQKIEKLDTGKNQFSFRKTTNWSVIDWDRLPANLFNRSLIVEWSLLDNIVNAFPDIEDLVQKNIVSNTDIKNFIKGIKEDIPYELDGEHYVRIWEKLLHMEEEWNVLLCEIEEKKSLQIK